MEPSAGERAGSDRPYVAIANTPDRALEALAAGAVRAFLLADPNLTEKLKKALAEPGGRRRDILDCLRAVAREERHAGGSGAGQGQRTAAVPTARPLTSRQEAILTLLLEGLTVRQVAERLGVSRTFVYASLRRISRKLGETAPASPVRPGPSHPSGERANPRA